VKALLYPTAYSTKILVQRPFVIVILAVLLLMGCMVQIVSDVEKKEFRKPYLRPLMVIPYDKVMESFAVELEFSLRENSRTYKKKAETLRIENKNEEINLGLCTPASDAVNKVITRDSIDLVFLFRVAEAVITSGRMVNVSYLIIGTDVKKKKNIWRTMVSCPVNGASPFRVAKKLYQQLVADKVL
jgi:hypothetical protein